MDKEREIRMSRDLSRASFWLMVDGRDRAWLAGIISRLAEEYGGPVFEPHLTLYSGPVGEIGEAGRILAKVAADCGKIKLQCSGLEFSDKYTKTCYLSLRNEPGSGG